MADSTRHEADARAWHGEWRYDSEEAVRLVRACEIIRRRANEMALTRRYQVLDVGCGVGPIREWLDHDNFEIVGLEINKESAAIAAHNYDDCLIGNVEDPWPFEPGSFDGVHAGAIMEHVVNWHSPLNQANRVLRDGGMLVISTPNLRYWKEIRKLIMGKQPHWMRDVRHMHAYTSKFLSQLVELHGFKVIDVQADHVNLPLLKWFDRRLSRWLAGIGSVIILAAQLVRRARVEHQSIAHLFSNPNPVGMRAVEVPLS